MIADNMAFQTIGFGAATGIYLLFSIVLVTKYRGRLCSGLLAIAALSSSIWAATLCWAALHDGLEPLQLLLLEMMQDAAWIAFLSALLSGVNSSGERQWIARFGGIALITGLVLAGVVMEANNSSPSSFSPSTSILIIGSILTSLFALVALEQIYRNARDGQRAGLKFLGLGVGGLFVYDLILYSNAIVVGQISAELWVARGAVVALCAPLIAYAVKRSPTLSIGIFVSRHVVFYTATSFAAGIYLTVVGFLGYYFKERGGVWGTALQIFVVFSAILAMLAILVSDRTRRRIRVSIRKHFFENKYDYRREWLRLIDTLTTTENTMPISKRGIQSLAQILNVHSGVLWRRQAGRPEFACVAGWNCQNNFASIETSSSIAEFLAQTGWVIELSEFHARAEDYPGLDVDTTQLGLEDPRYIVPLIHDGELLGFVVLVGNPDDAVLNFEDFDLLKTAGCQIAGYLGQEQATEKLSESRQFAAFNKLTAYLMHDLKNVIAQQVLLVDNAEKHKSKPEFIDDAIETIRGGIVRMRQIIDHLQQRSADQQLQRVELGKVVILAVAQCESKKPLPRLNVGDMQYWVRADPYRLQMGIYHVIRNAQDASFPDDAIEVRLIGDDTKCSIEVADSGAGMESKFLRERLFKPFDSTKGTEGMGIGAYQIRELVMDLGGEVDVESEVGVGTLFSITLPLVN